MAKVKKTNNQRILAYKNTQIIYLGDAEVKHWDELTANQLKIAMYSAAKVEPEDTHETKYTMTFKEFADLCKYDNDSDGGANYEKIYNEARKLARSGVDFKNKDGEIIIFNWLDRVTVSPKSGTVTYYLDPRLLPFYKTKKGSFAVVNLLDYMPLRGRYALLLYEFLAKWQNKGKVYQTVEDLRQQLRVPENKYQRSRDLIRQIVNRAVDEINEKAQYSFRVCIAEKRGKRGMVEGVTFYIDPIAELKEQTTENQDLTDLLTDLGIELPAARSLINTYSRNRILANIDNAKKKNSQGKVKTTLAATICAAIKDDYAQVEHVNLFSEDIIKAQQEISATAEKLAKADCPRCNGTGFEVRFVDNDLLPPEQRKIKWKCDCWSH